MRACIDAHISVWSVSTCKEELYVRKKERKSSRRNLKARNSKTNLFSLALSLSLSLSVCVQYMLHVDMHTHTRAQQLSLLVVNITHSLSLSLDDLLVNRWREKESEIPSSSESSRSPTCSIIHLSLISDSQSFHLWKLTHPAPYKIYLFELLVIWIDNI